MSSINELLEKTSSQEKKYVFLIEYTDATDVSLISLDKRVELIWLKLIRDFKLNQDFFFFGRRPKQDTVDFLFL